MTLRWLRLLVSALIVVSALTGAAAGFAAPGAHSCAGMTATDDCPDHSDRGAIPRRCDSLVCGVVQLAPTSSQEPMTAAEVDLALLPCDDAIQSGLSGPPDLRPPIS
jgi:hypothetical protein